MVGAGLDGALIPRVMARRGDGLRERLLGGGEGSVRTAL